MRHETSSSRYLSCLREHDVADLVQVERPLQKQAMVMVTSVIGIESGAIYNSSI